MSERNYLAEAEKLVSACEILEEAYVEAFNYKELQKCEMIARKLEQIDPDFKLQSGDTLAPMHKEAVKQSLQERKKCPLREHFVRIAIRLLKQGKYKPLP